MESSVWVYQVIYIKLFVYRAKKKNEKALVIIQYKQGILGKYQRY